MPGKGIGNNEKEEEDFDFGLAFRNCSIHKN
jgi:hypothetical protein